MNKTRKQNIKRILSLVCIVAVVAFLAAMPLIAKQDPQDDGPKASILSGTVETGSIDKELIGGGTLAQEDAVTIEVPSAVKLTEFLVTNGETVQEGDPIASVDRVSVMHAISQVQETLDYLAEQIEEESEADADGEVTALAGGIVKILYAEEGDSVQSVMLEHGALAVLSLDGLMAVDLTTDSALKAGASVTVIRPDGTEITGRVATSLAGELTVTVEDDDYAVGEAVQITDGETVLGSGELYIYNPWNATAYAGIVEDVEVKEGEQVDVGETLFELEDVGFTATYRQLVGQRQEYEALMMELFQMYQTETVTAPTDGIVSGIDENSLQLLTATEQNFILTFLANAPSGDDITQYTNYVGQVAGIDGSTLQMWLNPTPMSVTDYKDLSAIPTDTTAMTVQGTYSAEAPIYTLSNGEWTQISSSSINVGDILLFAHDSANNNFVWVVRLIAGSGTPDIPSIPTDPVIPDNTTEPPETTEPPIPDATTQPSTPGGDTEPSIPDSTTEPTIPSGTTEPSVPGGSTEPSVPGGSTDPSVPGGSTDPSVPDSTMPSTGGYPSGSGSFPSGGSFSYGGSWGSTTTMPQGSYGGSYTEPESTFELYGLDMVQIASVTSQQTMTLEITIDELDIRALQIGMQAQVKINALGGEKHTATITDIGNIGASNGGNSKYTVELTMERSENMLSGMNATAIIVLDSVADVLTIPADALVENGNETLVYTGYDEENETFLAPVSVEVGFSDGETVQILEGLSQGQSYYYAYYDTLEVSVTPDFGSSGFMF